MFKTNFCFLTEKYLKELYRYGYENESTKIDLFND